MVIITRKIEFDAGHRIPDHASKCRNAHGHRYVLEASVRGRVQVLPGASDNGMVQDFGDLKLLMQGVVGDVWDHGFLVHKDDLPMLTALHCLGEGHKTVLLDRVPTVENLVVLAALSLKAELEVGKWSANSLELAHVRLYETPNCWADWHSPKSRFGEFTNAA